MKGIARKMSFIISILILAVFVAAAGKWLRQKPIPFYIAAVILTVTALVVSGFMPDGLFNKYIISLFTKGALAGAMWCIVMWTGALPNGSRLMKALMPIRGEMSILAAAVTLCHCIYEGILFINRLADGGAFGIAETVSVVVSLLMLVIMIPLTVLSFRRVRSLMNPIKWKKIQCFAYLFYAMMYVHVLCVLVPSVMIGKTGSAVGVIIYSAVFFGYFAARLYKKSAKKKHSRIVLTIHIAVCVIAVLIVSMAVMIPQIKNICENSDADHSENEIELPIPETTALYRDGIYTASAEGYDGEITVTVEIADGRIVSITGESDESDEWFFDQVVKKLIPQIISSQSTDVDAVSGATYSSSAVKQAVGEILAEAEITE